MELSKPELDDLISAAEFAFWEVIAKCFPQATSGDLSIDLTCRLSVAQTKAVEEWIYLNVPDEQNNDCL